MFMPDEGKPETSCGNKQYLKVLELSNKKCKKDGSSFNTLNSFIRLKRDKTFCGMFSGDLPDWQQLVSQAFLTTNETSLIVTSCSYQQKAVVVQQSQCAIRTTLLSLRAP